MAEIINKDITDARKYKDQETCLYAVSGPGIFDDLMEAVTLHLDIQFKNGRFEGQDYSTVYLGAMQSVLQQAIAYLLGRQRADKEAELIAEQITHEKLKEGLTVSQTKLVEEQIIHEKLKEKVTIAQEANVKADTAVKVAQATNIAADTNVKQKQLEKLQQEIAFVIQKTKTELRQTQGSCDPDGGVLGAQICLYEKQAKGFFWNAQQKYLKTMNDAWSVNTNVSGEQDTAYGKIQHLDTITTAIDDELGVAHGS
jgi:hypothetical protein